VQFPPTRLVADDLTFNDYSTGDLLAMDPRYVLNTTAPESALWTQADLLFTAGKVGASPEAQDVVNGLRAEFQYGFGGSSGGSVDVNDTFDTDLYHRFATDELNEVVASSPKMQTYYDDLSTIIVDAIEANRGDTAFLTVDADLESNEIYDKLDRDKYGYPYFNVNSLDADERALSIAIHGFHGHRITLTNYAVDGDSFSGTLVFEDYDHFGLDTDDYVHWAGFSQWFTLQHHDRFDGKYVPPIVVATAEVDIHGEF